MINWENILLMDSLLNLKILNYVHLFYCENYWKIHINKQCKSSHLIIDEMKQMTWMQIFITKLFYLTLRSLPVYQPLECG